MEISRKSNQEFIEEVYQKLENFEKIPKHEAIVFLGTVLFEETKLWHSALDNQDDEEAEYRKSIIDEVHDMMNTIRKSRKRLIQIEVCPMAVSGLHFVEA